MAERVTVTASDGHTFDAWRSDPAGDVKGGIIFLQAIYGLTTHLGDVCDQFCPQRLCGHGARTIRPRCTGYGLFI